jgi:hypothetical protein
MPIPLGQQQIYGNGKLLLVTPEIRALAEQMVSGMGVPTEFLYGGISYSASSVSLRMLENMMLRHIEMIKRVLRFVVVRLRRFLRLPEIEIRFKNFKMADDAAVKSMAAELLQANKISAASFLPEIGYDVDVEQKQIAKEMDFFNEVQKRQMVSQAEAQAASQDIMGAQQLRMQIEQQKKMQKFQTEQTIDQEQGMVEVMADQAKQQPQQQPAQAQQAPPPQQGQPQQPQPQQPVQQQPPQAGGSGGPMPQEGRPATLDPIEVAATTAHQLIHLVPEEREKLLSMYKNKYPTLYPVIVASLHQLEQNTKKPKSIRPLPEIKPPRRAS